MKSTDALMHTDLPLPGRRQGKVRDIYQARLRSGADVLLVVATDRISAFDVVMPNGIGGKGVVLTQISRFWFDMIQRQLGSEIKHHLIATDANDVEGLTDQQRQQIDRRVMVGRRCKVVPIECVARGYLAGSGWKEYQQSQSVCGNKLPAGLRLCDKLPEPIFTPATKEEAGHDINVTFEQTCDIIGKELATKLRDWTLRVYAFASEFAAKRGIIIADTKFEFGIPLDDDSQQPILIDEALTPDSSRFWPADDYEPGREQASFDKQYVRNYLQELVDSGRWDKNPPGPKLPENIVNNTLTKYLEAYRQLTGNTLSL